MALLDACETAQDFRRYEIISHWVMASMGRFAGKPWWHDVLVPYWRVWG